MTAGKVIHNRAPLSKDAAKAALAVSLARLSQKHGLGSVADQAGVCVRTIKNAMAHEALPELHSVLNLLPLDPTALDELLAPLGLRIVSIEAADGNWHQMMADIAGTAATLATALTDGRVDHREEAQFLDAARPVVQVLTALLARRDRERSAA